MFLAFIIEHTLINTAPIVFAGGLVALFFGSFLLNNKIKSHFRAVVYSIFGAIAGVMSYSTYDIPSRSIEILEASTLWVGMFVYGFLMNIAVIAVKNRIRQYLSKSRPDKIKPKDWWRNKIRHFRKWAFLSIVWVLITLLLVAIYDPLGHGAHMSNKELMETLIFVFLPLLVLAVRYAYQKLVD